MMHDVNYLVFSAGTALLTSLDYTEFLVGVLCSIVKA